MRFDRENKDRYSVWWWTVDRVSLFVVLALVAFGCLMVGSAGSAVAERFGGGAFYFVNRQIIFALIGLSAMLGLSMTSESALRRIAVGGFVLAYLLTAFATFFGHELNGARRWLSIAGFSLQPSELLKPFFCVTVAWLLSLGKRESGFNGYLYAFICYLFVVGLLLKQPDFGMTILVSAVWAAQIFLSGIPIWQTVVLAGGGCALFAGAYLTLEHVRARVSAFLGETGYQVEQSLRSFRSGGMGGRGPGEGVVKPDLPDAHTDFIFAVIAEELGVAVNLAVIGLYLAVVALSTRRLLKEQNLFVLLAGSGLLIQFGLQAMINMAVSVNMLPAKGMTLPLISYGGSSMMSSCVTLGFILRMTRRRYGRCAPGINGLPAY
ncbi:MAG: putative peptidoglycan glycosyltransferase FtsW [Rickettsiales bacterium]